MEKENLYESIEAYLDGELEGEALATFEQELATDIVLAREVNLHRRLQHQLSDGPKLDLRAALETIADEFEEPDIDIDTKPNQQTPKDSGGAPGGGIPFWWWGLGFFLIVGVSTWWYVSSLDADTSDTSSAQVENISTPTATEETTTTEATTAPLATTPEKTEQTTPIPASRPTAFDTNTQLEAPIGEETATLYRFTDDQLKYEVQGQRTYLDFSSKLTTSESVADGLFLQLYTNQYPKGRVFREPLVISPVNPDAPIAFAGRKEYFAVYSGETKLEPALYYGVITRKDSTKPIWVGKVRVE